MTHPIVYVGSLKFFLSDIWVICLNDPELVIEKTQFSELASF